ncbi:MAG: hypothetical protein COA53_07775 [Rhodobacteraceae bacterium]|nr:MAG: hypothetical protein COA53_07775 [Paracoccaceae bacterium]
MSDGNEYRFGDFALVCPKISLKKGKTFSHVGMENISPGYKYVSAKRVKEYKGSGSKFENKDTLFARITPCLENGKIAQVKNLEQNKGFGSTEFFVFRGIPEISDSDFVYYYSQTNWFRQNAENSMVGTSGRQRADAGFISKSIFVFPDLHTQKKIARILSAYDDLLENNFKRIKLIDEMARITYEEWFVRLRFPGHEAAPENPKTGLLEGWKEVKLGDVLELIKRGVAPKYVEEGGIMVINQKCIRDHRINLSFVRQTSKDKKIPAEKLVKYSDILVNSTGTGTLGRVAQYFGPNKFCTVDTHVTIVRANTLKVSTYILGRFLEHIEPFLVNLGKGATNQQELAGSDMSVAIKLKLPPLELQAKYEDMVKPIFEEIENLQNQNRRLREARDILLPRLMTGMIDVEHYKPENLLKEVA